MKKIAFHFYNDGVPDIDFTNITDGNPGVGGTVFLAVLIPSLLASRKIVEPILLSNRECIIPKHIHNVVCKDLYGALDYCRKHKEIEAIIIDSTRIDLGVINKYIDVKIILWANCPMSIKYLKGVTNLPNIQRIINVGKEQCDLCRDMNVFKKSTYIYNAFPINKVLKYRENSQPTSKRKHNVVYIASILPPKGFHLLAKAWPTVLKNIPDAELFVIGSGKLYNKQCKLGKWGVSIPEYEEIFMSYLTKDGSILPSVHFLGEMGMEKYEIMSKCKVGVPNPSGATETFGYTAIEMQAMGCFVTTKKCPGYIDTVYDKSQLYKNSDVLANNIINLLNKQEDQPEEILSWIKKEFNCETIIKRWEEELCSNMSEDVIAEPLSETDLNFHQKHLKEFIRKFVPYRVKDYLIPIEKICAVWDRFIEHPLFIKKDNF